jgi:hypothetical protein
VHRYIGEGENELVKGKHKVEWKFEKQKVPKKTSGLHFFEEKERIRHSPLSMLHLYRRGLHKRHDAISAQPRRRY